MTDPTTPGLETCLWFDGTGHAAATYYCSLFDDAQKLYDISSTATASCWSLNNYCPAPGPVPTSPANRDYKPGFAAALMLKDLRIAMQAAQGAGAATPLGAHATQIYGMMDLAGQSGLDFSGVIKFINGLR